MSKTFDADWLKPVWSRQHGAYIALLTSWLIATIVSRDITVLHGVVLITILSGFNGIEILQEFLKRRTTLPPRKRLWAGLYGVTGGAGSLYLLHVSPKALWIMPILALAGVIFVWLSVRRRHKNVPAEWLAFSNLVLAGLLAHEPSRSPNGEMMEWWLVLSSYFGVSIFVVKVRFDRVSGFEILSYGLMTMVAILFTVTWRAGIPFLLVLIAARLLSVLVASEWYRQRSIRFIGFMELGYCLVLVLITSWGF